ncbi:MAG TPA: glycosyltransferase family 4 protein [Nevskiales bacterium]|nr:glycosyltransferase family 4 protein [Nevskiales bacterium]
MPDRLRVVVVNDYALPVGGASSVALAQARGLAARGHEVILFSAVPAHAPQAKDGVHYFSCNQTDLLGASSRAAAGIQGLWNRKAAQQLTELLRQQPRHTVVHLHSWTKALSASTVAAIADSGLASVCTLHDYFVACPNGGFFNYQQSRACPLKPLSLACISCHCDARHYSHKLWRTLRQFVQQYAGGMPRRMRHFICVSDFSRELIEPYLPEGSQIHVVPSAIAVEQHPPLSADQRQSIVFVGRLAREKGVMTYLEACRIAGIAPVLLGDGELASWIRAHYPQASLSGWLPSDKLHHAMRRALALAAPTLAYETQQLTILEAAALGVPAIVSSHSAGARYVEPERTGAWVEAGDAAKLAEIMRRMQSDKDYTIRLGQEAYHRFWSCSEYRPEHCLQQIETVYAGCLAGQ